VTSLGLSSTFEVTTFDQNFHHLCSTSPGGKDLSDDTQIRVICPMQHEIFTGMLKKLSVKLGKTSFHSMWLLDGKNCLS